MRIDPATGQPWSYATRTAYLQRRNGVRAIAAWVLVVVSAVAFAARYLELAWQPVVVLAAFSCYLGPAAFLGALLFWLGQRTWHALAALLLATASIAVEIPLFVGGAAPSSHPVTVLQANLDLGTADMGALVRAVAGHDVALLTLEELTPEAASRAEAAGLDRFLPYRMVEARSGGAGLGVWSRFPIIAGRTLPGFGLGVIQAEVTLPGIGTTDVFAVHVAAPWPTPSGQWAADLDLLALSLRAAEHGPVLAMGDFNATWDQSRFRSALAGFDDAGAGWLPTYPADKPWPPLLAIDHITMRSLVAANFRTLPLAGSDHRGLLATVGAKQR